MAGAENDQTERTPKTTKLKAPPSHRGCRGVADFRGRRYMGLCSRQRDPAGASFPQRKLASGPQRIPGTPGRESRWYGALGQRPDSARFPCNAGGSVRIPTLSLPCLVVSGACHVVRDLAQTARRAGGGVRSRLGSDGLEFLTSPKSASSSPERAPPDGL